MPVLHHAWRIEGQAMTLDKKLGKFAEVIVKVGLNLQEGQRLLIGPPIFLSSGTPIENAPLVAKITEQAYKAGAKLVSVIWEDPSHFKLRMEHGPASTYDEYETWKVNTALEFIDNGDAILVLYAQDPNALAAYDPEITGAMQMNASQQTSPVLARVASGATNWCIISAPVDGWTQAVLPNRTVDEFWDVIFKMSRADGENPVQDWEHHLDDLEKRKAYLQAKRYTALQYSGPGTDLTVGLPDGHLWHSGKLTSKQGISNAVNIPTEEVFTMPHKTHVDGIVSATKPLPFAGTLIENLRLTFKEGRVVEASASKGEVLLQQLLETDAGSRHLGEVALVPHSSPISQSGLVFYNILFDENASCHLALGNAYRFSMEGAMDMSEEEWAAAGGNTSAIHLDFMMGSGQLNVDGVTPDDSTEPVMRSGEWAFEL